MAIALQPKPERAIADLKTLAQFGKFETGVNRRSLTAEDVEARAWLLARMHEAGLDAHIDGIGNVVGRTPGAKRFIIIASHTDTVPRGGWLDGAMGVIFGLEIARAYVEAEVDADLGIEVISFNDEEGRFSGLLGSRVFSGALDLDAALELTAADGVTLREALVNAGYASAVPARFDSACHAAYLEPHIEQGPVLEDAGKRIGLVTDIVGVARMKVTFTGAADHAGTMPMPMRKDAAAAAYDFAVRFARFCSDVGSASTVWNLGNVTISPGAYNVVAREAEILVEYRDTSSVVLKKIRDHVHNSSISIAAEHRVNVEVEQGVYSDPVAMAPALLAELELAAKQFEAPYLHMPSGAGHDAMLFTKLVPTAMLFVPSIGGRSHDVVEDTSEADIALGCRVLGRAVASLIEHGV